MSSREPISFIALPELLLSQQFRFPRFLHIRGELHRSVSRSSQVPTYVSARKKAAATTMYPPAATEEHYPPEKGCPPPQPPVGVPVGSGNQYYPPGGPSALHVQAQAPGTWSTGLCDCCVDPCNCCLTWCCPCITFGRIADIADRGSTSCGASGALYALISILTGCGWAYSCFYRSKIRKQYSLVEHPCNDCLVHCCCETCALSQEYRELRNRGFDMALGWHGNLGRQGAGGVTAPPGTQGGMTR